MSLEDNVFKRYSPILEKLEEFGFKKVNVGFILERLFKDNLFKAIIKINANGKVSGTVFDLENEDEFLPLRVESNQGAFVGEVRVAYEELLENIRDNCFIKNYYNLPQSNRITNFIIEKYGDEPEFLWEKSPGSGIFRNPKTRKWYLAILEVDRARMQKGRKGLVEVADIKLAPEHIEELLMQEHFYPAYHMNKKCWITVILDDSVSDEKIMELIAESYSYAHKKK